MTFESMHYRFWGNNFWVKLFVVGIILAFGLGFFKKNSLAEQLQKNQSRPNNEEAFEIENRPIVFKSGGQVLGTQIMVPVLMYHYIRVNPYESDKVGFGLSVIPSEFNKQITYLKDHGYTSITLDEMANAWFGKEGLPEKPVVLTFDDGYEDFYTQAFSILKQHNFKAINFIITGLVGTKNYLTWSEIEQMESSGLITFGSHTINHPALTYLNPTKAKYEISESKKILESHLGYKVNWFAYPYGDVNAQVAQYVKDAGYVGAFGTAFGFYQDTDFLFTLPRVRVGGGESVQGFANRLPWK